MRHDAGCCALLRSVLLGRHELLGLLVGADLGVEGRRQVRHRVRAAHASKLGIMKSQTESEKLGL